MATHNGEVMIELGAGDLTLTGTHHIEYVVGVDIADGDTITLQGANGNTVAKLVTNGDMRPMFRKPITNLTISDRTSGSVHVYVWR